MSLPPLPPPDTHCFDEDTGISCWSHSPAQMQAYGQQCYEQALLDAMNATRAFGKTGAVMAKVIGALK
jgi:hypothetical protein